MNKKKIEELKLMLSSIVENRNWYVDTGMNRFEARNIKKSLYAGTISTGRIIYILIQLGKIDIILRG